MLPRTGVHTPTSMRASDDLPDAVGPITPSALPPVSEKLTSWQTIVGPPGTATAAPLHDKRARRRLQRHRRVLYRKMRQQIRQPRPALPRGDKAAPIGDRKVDRRQRAAAQDRAGDDDARRRLLIDHQPGADRENGGLQQQAQHFRHRAETAGDVAGALA